MEDLAGQLSDDSSQGTDDTPVGATVHGETLAAQLARELGTSPECDDTISRELGTSHGHDATVNSDLGTSPECDIERELTASGGYQLFTNDATDFLNL